MRLIAKIMEFQMYKNLMLRKWWVEGETTLF